MTYREIRDFAEHLRILGYPNSVAWGSTGDGGGFPALASLLDWLAGRVEQGGTLQGGAATEMERVMLIRSAVEFMATKAAIKLNPRRLYGGGGPAAKELLKVTTMLVSAPRTVDESGDELASKHIEIDLTDKVEELRTARVLSSELTTRGASLYDLVAKELKNRDVRIATATRPMELFAVESALRSAVESLKKAMVDTQEALVTTKSDSETLQSKIARKQSELDRARQRLTALTKVRPAFLDELERCEVELKDLYDKYVLYVRCQASLRAQLKNKNGGEDSLSGGGGIKADSVATLPQPKKPRACDFSSDSDEDNDDEEDEEIHGGHRDSAEPMFKMKQSTATREDDRSKTRLRVRTGAGVDRGRIFGDMRASGIGKHLDSDSSLDDSDSLGLEGGIDDEDLGTDDERAPPKPGPSMKPMSSVDQQELSDDGF